MSYKTILVHLSDERRAGQLLQASLHLARASKAHLIGLCVVPPVVIAPGMDGGGAAVIEEHRTVYREQMSRIRQAFEAATRLQTFQSEWRELDAGYRNALDLVMDHGRTADLIIASQADPEWGYSEQLEAPERLAIESGRPVLLIPVAGKHDDSGNGFAKRVVVAWNGRRESARAIFDALPLLKHAEHVAVVWINPHHEGAADGDLPGVDMCGALARHGVKCEATQTIRLGAGIGETLLSMQKTSGADLLVMGCYGHSRFREFVFGGATRHVLTHMTGPVLMSH